MGLWPSEESMQALGVGDETSLKSQSQQRSSSSSSSSSSLAQRGVLQLFNIEYGELGSTFTGFNNLDHPLPEFPYGGGRINIRGCSGWAVDVVRWIAGYTFVPGLQSARSS